MNFITAEWRKLALINYEINPEILQKYLPEGVELDFWDNKCYVSLVGFMFLNTKLLNIAVPFHQDFEEVNLRFYVKKWENNEWKRGVVFIKEIVPKKALTFVANTFYQEHYETREMKHSISESQNLEVSYQWKTKNWNTISIKAEKIALEMPENSEVEFITEHYWGYTKLSNGKTSEYQVTHPRWKYYPITEYQLEVDFAENYGDDFEVLTTQKPVSVMLAEGSEIEVKTKKSL